MKFDVRNLTPEQWVHYLAAGLTGFLMLLLLVGIIWVYRMPPAPMIAPDPHALSAVVWTVEERDFSDFVVQNDDSVPLDISFVHRPLFWPSRRPYEVNNEEVAAVVDDNDRRDSLAQAKLLGFYNAGDGSGIILSLQNTKTRLRLKDEVQGWVLKELNVDGAVFARGQRERRLLLEHAIPAQHAASSSLGKRHQQADKLDAEQ